MANVRVDLRNRDAQSLTEDKFSSVNVESRGSSALTSAPREAQGRPPRMVLPVAEAMARLQAVRRRKPLRRRT